MLTDCEYDKIRIKHDLCRLQWFLTRHAIANAEKDDKEIIGLYQDMEKTIENYISKIS